ncbi:unnamed protein product [Laminaria digitata]
MASSDPTELKALGRAVSTDVSEQGIRDRCRFSVTYQASMNIIGHNQNLIRSLFKTGINLLTKARPYHIVRGIGNKADDP